MDVSSQGRRQASLESAQIVQLHQLDFLAQGPVQERGAVPDSPEAHDLAEAFEVDRQQGGVVVLDAVMTDNRSRSSAGPTFWISCSGSSRSR
ncbi:hypothetical protein LP52_05480 [Streptomonospora alba]|uniref:Uncharacterized protein n=1 Tax=Streptomonospora alba TaxID=183763 RepID=A0A0C2JEE2_9ACTN|nr:hypothetical protein LP52_05480 [Streptomonospora alba]